MLTKSDVVEFTVPTISSVETDLSLIIPIVQTCSKTIETLSDGLISSELMGDPVTDGSGAYWIWHSIKGTRLMLKVFGSVYGYNGAEYPYVGVELYEFFQITMWDSCKLALMPSTTGSTWDSYSVRSTSDKLFCIKLPYDSVSDIGLLSIYRFPNIADNSEVIGVCASTLGKDPLYHMNNDWDHVTIQMYMTQPQSLFDSEMCAYSGSSTIAIASPICHFNTFEYDTLPIAEPFGQIASIYTIIVQGAPLVTDLLTVVSIDAHLFTSLGNGYYFRES